MVALDGHGSGADELFQALLDEEQNSALGGPQLEFLSTHPLSRDRIDAMTELAQEHHWTLNAKTTSLPLFMPAGPSSSPERGCE